MGMNLGLIQNSARREFEGVDRPAQIGLSILAPERKSFANSRLVHMDHGDARPFQIGNLSTKRTGAIPRW
jgi:hypothetical protein